MKVMDIKQPRGSWEENYAHVEYMRTGINNTFAKKIQIDQVYICMTCKKENTFWRWECEDCDNKAAMSECYQYQGDDYER